MAWPIDPRPAKALIALRQQVIALAPDRSTSSEGAGLYGGMLASAEHHAANPTSDHEPNANGVVRATDITNDPRHGMSSRVLAQQILDSHDERIKYVISDRQIASGSGQTHEAWTWRPYSLANTGDPHTEHCHVSLKGDAALYDDAKPWEINSQIADANAPPAAPGKPLLKVGSIGVDVRLVQTLLFVDGIFGPITEEGVKHFQETHGLHVDGIVGAHTWAALLQIARPPTPVVPGELDIPAITALAAASPLAHVNWIGRGTAPIGYVKGMAVSFALCLNALERDDAAAIEMAKANTGNDEKDALSWYNSNFAAKGMSNAVSGPDTLRHLFVLMIGLGMRESSGKHCEGRDTSANNTSADTAETGLFQMSWDAHGASPLIPQLLTKYQGAISDPTSPIFAEGVTCGAASWSNAGTGTGAVFQQLCKSRPGLAVETAAVGLRNIRKHWGPINRKEAELRPEADALLRQVEQLMAVAPATASLPAASTPSPLDTLARRSETAPAAVPAAPEPRLLRADPVPVSELSISVPSTTEAVAIPPPSAISSTESTLNMNDASAALLRYVLIAGFTGLAVYGYVDPKTVPGMVDNVLPAISTIAGGLTMLWGVYVNIRSKRVPMATAMRADVPTVNAITGATQPGNQFTK